MTDNQKEMEESYKDFIKQSAMQNSLTSCLSGVDMLADILIAQPEMMNFKYLIEVARDKSKFALIDAYKTKGLVNVHVKTN